MDKTLYKPIYYLEPQDIDDNGNLSHPFLQDKTVVCMIQANFCGYCTEAKPAFQAFAENNPDVVCVTIQGDSEAKEQLSNKIQAIKNGTFQGYPDYALFKNGKKVNRDIRGRDQRSLRAFANSV